MDAMTLIHEIPSLREALGLRSGQEELRVFLAAATEGLNQLLDQATTKAGEPLCITLYVAITFPGLTHAREAMKGCSSWDFPTLRNSRNSNNRSIDRRNAVQSRGLGALSCSFSWHCSS
jgi:hypothetical protein